MQEEYKFVKRAGMYVKTTTEIVRNGVQVKNAQKQEWISKEQFNALPKKSDKKGDK